MQATLLTADQPYQSNQRVSRPRILFIVDQPNWAHDIKTSNLMRSLCDEYDVSKCYETEVTSADLDRADLIVVYYWYQFEVMRHLEACFKKHRQKLLVGVCSNAELEGPRRETGKALLCDLAGAIFMINLSLYTEHAHQFDVPVFCTPNGVDVDFYTPIVDKQPSSVMRVGWAGSLTNHGPDHRGYYDLILPAIRSLEGVQLVTAAREEKWRSPEEMREFYRSLDLYVCASRNEGGPNPCLEAAACGVPLLTTRVGSMPELVRHGISGFFIERDLEDLSSKLRLLRDNSDLRSSMARQIHKDVQSWGWSISAEPYRQMLKHMLKQPEIVAAESEVKSEEGAIDNAPAMGLPLMSAEEVKGAVMMLAKSNLLLLPQTFIAEHQRVEVTVVILSYGRVELTLNALRSLLDNSSLRFKLLLIDNGSSEEVKNRLTEFCAEHDFIELIFLDQNLGCAGGRMFALDRVSTKYVMFIDNDIEIFPGTLEHLLYALESNPQLHAAAAKVILPDGLVHLCGGDYMSKDDVLSYELLGSGLRFDDPAIGGSGLCKWINGGATMFRKAAFLSQPFDLAMQGYYEDLEWCYRLNQIGEGLFHRSVEALALHYHRPPTLADAASSEDKRQQSVKYIEAIAHFYRIHGRIVQNIFDFVPELRPPSDQLVISAARMFLELVNSVGTDWLMERWNGNRLDPLFAATRLSTESAQLVEAQGRVMELTDRLAISKAKFSAKTVEDGKTIESLTESLAKSNANFNARTVEDGKTIESLRDRLARSEQLVRVLVTERRETRKSLEHLLEEMSLKEAEKQKIIDEKQETIDQKQKLIEEKQKLIEEKQTSIEELSLLASALEAEIQRLKSTLGWRLLNVYGRIKYRYLLPVYRMGRSKNPEEGLDEESKDDKESLAG